MKTENLVQYILRLTVTLLLITGAVAAALAGVNAITKDAIAANQEKKTQDEEAILTLDGQRAKELSAEDTIVIRRSEKKAYLIQLTDQSFFDVLHRKLGNYEIL